jgi:1-acyl-sn-glycerol-3-phosphate acyltransferase
MAILSAIGRAWRHLVWRAAGLYFNRVRILHAERLPESGPALYVGLHRNGAVDGFLYHQAAPRAVFMISRQLRASLLGRIFFFGIEVVRDKDRAEDSAADRARNSAALEACLQHLDAGGELFVLPEGTSDLGPRHLPFKRGAASVACAFLARGGRLAVVPLGIHYERAWAFRSNVEIVVGAGIDTRLPEAASAQERIELLHARLTQALETVGVNLHSALEQERVEPLAYAATLGTGHSYFEALKAFEPSAPPAIAEAFERLQRDGERLGLWRHQGVPLVPTAHSWLYVLALPVLGTLVAAALLLNLPPLLAALAASRALADGRNVIALWRILVGLPLLCFWILALALIAAANGAAVLFALYAVLSALGFAAFYRTQKLAVSVYNLARGRALRGTLLALRRQLDHAVTHAR